MRKTFLILFALLFISCTTKNNKKDLELWYNKPAQNWNEALPIGNGHIGAMIYGGVEKEQLKLNDNTLYSGDPKSRFNNKKFTQEEINKVVSMMKDGKYHEVTQRVQKDWLYKGQQPYMPFGDLIITNNKKGKVISYRRSLNISKSLAEVSYTQNDVNYKREIFASYPDNVIIIHYIASNKNSIDINLKFTSPHITAQTVAKDGHLLLNGKAPGFADRRPFKVLEERGYTKYYPELYDSKGNRKFDHTILYGDEIDGRGMTFSADLKPVLSDEGKVEVKNGTLHIYNTDDVFLVLSMSTSYNGFDKDPATNGVDPIKKNTRTLQDASKYNYAQLKERHVKDYQNLFNRVKLTLNSSDATTDLSELTTDNRIDDFDQRNDPALASLLFQYGRYLMISTSRPGGQPSNLQGMWSVELQPFCACANTMNINTEMNYWPSEMTNLSECNEPLFQMIKELMVTGAKTAKDMFGNRGWVAFHTCSIWRESFPNNAKPKGSFWPMAEAWLSSHLYEHY